MADKPESIRVAVPESFGPAFGEGEDRQWVERKVYIGRKVKTELSDLLEGFDYAENLAFDRLCEIFSTLFTAWKLMDEAGEPLPEPWENPKAFEALADASLDLFLWLSRVIHTPLGMLIVVPKN